MRMPSRAHLCKRMGWKNQHSVLVQDLDAEPKSPVFLESLRKLGVRTYYVFPLTTSRHKLVKLFLLNLSSAENIARLGERRLKSQGLLTVEDGLVESSTIA